MRVSGAVLERSDEIIKDWMDTVPSALLKASRMSMEELGGAEGVSFLLAVGVGAAVGGEGGVGALRAAFLAFFFGFAATLAQETLGGGGGGVEEAGAGTGTLGTSERSMGVEVGDGGGTGAMAPVTSLREVMSSFRARC